MDRHDVLMAFIVGLIIGGVMALILAYAGFRRDAIRSNAAHYELRDGEAVFVWGPLTTARLEK